MKQKQMTQREKKKKNEMIKEVMDKYNISKEEAKEQVNEILERFENEKNIARNDPKTFRYWSNFQVENQGG